MEPDSTLPERTQGIRLAGKKVRPPALPRELPDDPLDADAALLVKVGQKFLASERPWKKNVFAYQDYVRDWLKEEHAATDCDPVVVVALQLYGRSWPEVIHSDMPWTLQAATNTAVFATKVFVRFSDTGLQTAEGLGWRLRLVSFFRECGPIIAPKMVEQARIVVESLCMRIGAESPDALALYALFRDLSIDDFGRAVGDCWTLLRAREFGGLPDAAEKIASLFDALSPEDQIDRKNNLTNFIRTLRKMRSRLGEDNPELPPIAQALIIFSLKRCDISTKAFHPRLLPVAWCLKFFDCWEAIHYLDNAKARLSFQRRKAILDEGIECAEQWLRSIEQKESDDSGGISADRMRERGHFHSRLGDCFRLRAILVNSDDEVSLADYERALKHLEESLKSLEFLEDEKRAGAAGFNISRIAECLWELGYTEEAEENWIKVVEWPDPQSKIRAEKWTALRELGRVAAQRGDFAGSNSHFFEAVKIWEPEADSTRQPLGKDNALIHSDLCQNYFYMREADDCLRQARFYWQASRNLAQGARDFGRSKVLSLAARALTESGRAGEAAEWVRERVMDIEESQWRLRALGWMVYAAGDESFILEFEKAFSQAAESNNRLNAVYENKFQFQSLLSREAQSEYFRVQRLKIRSGGSQNVIEELRPYVHVRRWYWLDGGEDNAEVMILFGMANRMLGKIDSALSTVTHALHLAFGRGTRARILVEMGLCHEHENRADFEKALARYRAAFRYVAHPRSLEGILRCYAGLKRFDEGYDFLMTIDPTWERVAPALIREMRRFLSESDPDIGQLQRMLGGVSRFQATLIENCVGPDYDLALQEKIWRASVELLRAKKSGPAERLVPICNRILAAFHANGAMLLVKRCLSEYAALIVESGQADYLLEALTAARDASLCGALWRYVEAARECLASGGGDAVQEFNRILTGAAWKRLLPEGCRHEALLPAGEVMKISARRLCRRQVLAESEILDGLIQFQDAASILYDVEAFLFDSGGPLSVLNELNKPRLVWRMNAGSALVLNVHADFSSFVHPQRSWQRLRERMGKSLDNSSRFGLRLVLENTSVGKFSLTTKIQVLRRPRLSDTEFTLIDRFLDSAASEMLVRGNEPAGLRAKGLDLLSRRFAPDRKSVGDYLHYRLDQTYGLSLANILGLTYRSALPGTGHPAFALHPLKRRIGLLTQGTAENSDLAAELENDLAEAYRSMLKGYNAQTDFGDGLAAHFDRVLDRVLERECWIEQPLERESDGDAYVAVSQTALDRILQPLLHNAFQAANGEPVTLLAKRLVFSDGESEEGDGNERNCLLVTISNPVFAHSGVNAEGTGVGLPGCEYLIDACGGVWNAPIVQETRRIHSFSLPLLQ